MLCFYECGQEAKYRFKNGRWCCSISTTLCPTVNKGEIIRKKEEGGKRNIKNETITEEILRKIREERKIRQTEKESKMREKEKRKEQKIENKKKENRIKKIRKNKQKKSKALNRRVSNNIRSRTIHALKRNQKSGHTLKLLGCSIEDFKKYIESKWLPGMSWNNYGIRGWHLDHVIPCAAFDLSKTEDQKKCSHHTNYQPLWWRDNISKGKRIKFNKLWSVKNINDNENL